MTDLSVDVRPLEDDIRVGHIFSRAWDVFTANFIKFVVISGVATLPSVLLFANNQVSAQPGSGSVWRVLAGTVIAFPLNMLAQAVILYIAFQYLRGHQAPLGEAVQRSLGRLLPIIGLLLLSGLAIMLGTILLIIPGIMLMVRWSVSLPACVVERLGPVKSLTRSADLTAGHRWKIFGIFLLIWIASLILAGLTGVLFHPLGATAELVAALVWRTVWAAYFNSMWVMLYYDLRVAKDGVDVEQIASVFD